jgi:hypothetical protein
LPHCDEAGKQVLSKSSISRVIKRYNREQAEKKATSSIKSLERIATALEWISFFLENPYKKPGSYLRLRNVVSP